MIKSNPNTLAAIKNRDIPRHPELELLGRKVDLHMRPALQSDPSRLNHAAGNAQIKDAPTKKQCAMRQKDLGMPLASIAGMLPTLRRSRTIRFGLINRRHALQFIGGKA